MAHIKPFQAWHYNSHKISPECVIAPPYDVISKTEAEALRKREPHNVIRLILGQASPEDLAHEDRYRQAKKHLDRWTQEGILKQEAKVGYYLHETSYEHPGQKKTLTRLAFFTLFRLEPFERKVVFGHERTHASPKADRGKLLRATRANFSPIFSLYEDPTDTLDDIRAGCEKCNPLFRFTDDSGMGHHLWPVTEPTALKRITSTLDQKRVFIADGHHRYEAALRYCEEQNLKNKGGLDRPWDYALGAFVRFTDPGLLILPIHRVISRTASFDRDQFLAGLKQHFVLHSVSRAVLEKISDGALAGLGVALSETECYLMELKDLTTARQAMPEGRGPSWYELDVNLLSYLIVGPVLGITEQALEQRVVYTPSVGEAFKKLKMREAVCSFVMCPVTPRTIKDICETGELMPQKSTYFYPKFPSGLLMYRH